MTAALFFRAVLAYALGLVLMGGLIFWPAGTWYYPQGWLLMGTLFLPIFLLGLVLMIKSPALLEKRLNHKEKQVEQSLVVKLSGLMFVVGFAAAGLDYRYQWTMLPIGVSKAAAVVLLLSYLLYGQVMRENAFLSRTIEVQQGQYVVDTGLYGVVRHPMYAATVVLFLSMPLVLGSVVSLVVFLAYPVLIAKRIRNEEEVLEEGLEGYKEYKKKVKYKMIPFIW